MKTNFSGVLSNIHVSHLHLPHIRIEGLLEADVSSTRTHKLSGMVIYTSAVQSIKYCKDIDTTFIRTANSLYIYYGNFIGEYFKSEELLLDSQYEIYCAYNKLDKGDSNV